MAGRYAILARPTVPARRDELDWPAHLTNLIAEATSPALDFSEDSIDVKAAFECGEGQRA